jgi:hypothetical protein
MLKKKFVVVLQKRLDGAPRKKLRPGEPRKLA